MIGFMGTFFTITINYNSPQSMTKTRFIPYWTTSVFCSTVTDWVLIYESVTSSSSAVRWLTLHRRILNSTTELLSEFSYDWMNAEWRLTYEWMNEWIPNQSQSYITTYGQSASLSWNKAPIWGLRPDLYYCQTVACLFVWGALSDDRSGMSFTFAAAPPQCSHFRVWVPWDSWPYLTVSDSRLPPFITRNKPNRNHQLQQFLYYSVFILCC
jgi:hypothetical protein